MGSTPPQRCQGQNLHVLLLNLRFAFMWVGNIISVLQISEILLAVLNLCFARYRMSAQKMGMHCNSTPSFILIRGAKQIYLDPHLLQTAYRYNQSRHQIFITTLKTCVLPSESAEIVQIRLQLGLHSFSDSHFHFVLVLVLWANEKPYRLRLRMRTHPQVCLPL